MKKISALFTVLIFAITAAVTAVFFGTLAYPDEAADGAPVTAAITVPQEYYTFTITRSGANYSAVCVELALNLTNSGIKELIADIDTATGAGKVKKLNFQGTSGNALDIGAETAYLNSGTYIIAGKITGNYGIIYFLGDNLYVDGVEIAATENGCAFYNNSSGNINILSGTISSTGSYAIWNNLAGAINISGGEVKAINAVVTSGIAICNNRNGEVNISGGTVSAVTGTAIRNYSTGKVTVSEAAGKKTLITSANTTLDRGTIFLDNITTTSTVLEITGGVVENTANSSYANAIYNLGTGNIKIKGGEVNSGSIAINNINTGNVDISGGTVKAVNMNGTAIYSNSGKISISGTAMVTSVNTSSNTSETGTVRLSSVAVLEISGGVVENTASSTNACAIINLGVGNSIEIKGGEVKATIGRAIFNENNGKVFISGGKVSATTGKAVYNYRGGEINISGGEVEATTGIAVYINCYNGNTIGKLRISQAAGKATLITSKNTTDREGTIYLAFNSSSNNQTIFEITGGTVENTADNPNACALFNSGSLSEIKGGSIKAIGSYAIRNENYIINISGGSVSAIDGSSMVGSGIWNGSSGTINISGGEIKRRIWNDSTGVVNISGGTLTGGISNNGAGAIRIFGGEVIGNTSIYTIYNAGAGDIEVSGGKVKAADGGTAIWNESAGAVVISSGTVSADYGSAIRNYGTGKITVSGTALITSGNTYDPGGTVLFNNAGGELIFTGGNITNTAGGNVFYNPNNATLTVPVMVSVNGPAFWNQNVSYVPEGHVIGLSKPLTDPVSTFTFEAFKYQWYKVVPGGEDTLIPGAEGKNLTVKNISDSGTYYAMVFTYILGIKSAEGVKSEETTINIGKASSAGSISLDGWIAGKNANNPVLLNVPSECGTPVYEYKLKGDPDSAYAATKPTEAGEYTVRASFVSTENYNSFNITANFTIAPADGSGGLSAGAIAGIAAGAVGIIGLIVLVIIIKKRKKKLV